MPHHLFISTLRRRQVLLVLAFEVLLEDEAADLESRMLVSEAGFFLAERRVEIRIVVDLAWATNAGVERLLGPAVALQGVRVEQIPSLFGEGQAALVPAKIDRGDKAFVAKVSEGSVLRPLTRHREECPAALKGQQPPVLIDPLCPCIELDPRGNTRPTEMPAYPGFSFSAAVNSAKGMR